MPWCTFVASCQEVFVWMLTWSTSWRIMAGMRTTLLGLILACALGGCASAGPVVADVSWDDSGILVVQRCYVRANFFLGTMRLNECSFHELRIMPTPKRRSSWTFTPDGQARPHDPD